MNENQKPPELTPEEELQQDLEALRAANLLRDRRGQEPLTLEDIQNH